MIYRFAEYELDTARHELRQAGILSPLEPQVFHLLTYLIEHRYRVVSKQELLDHLSDLSESCRFEATYCAMT